VGRGRSADTKRLLIEARRVLEEIQPATVRGVCYKLFSAGLLPSMEKGSTDKMSNLLAREREDGTIPWEWIVDDGRQARQAAVWNTKFSFAKATVSDFRLDPWSQQAVRVEVWSEKGTVAGVLAPVLTDLAVTFRVNKGFTSATAVNEIANETHADPRPLRVLYVGDYDPSGLYMSEVDLLARLSKYGARSDWMLKRVALAEADLVGLADMSFGAKPKDPRYRWYVNTTGRTKAWELDAMDPNVLRERVRSEITGFIDTASWERIEAGERAQRESLKAVMAGWAKLNPYSPASPEMPR
jgi:hypothetical protein